MEARRTHGEEPHVVATEFPQIHNPDKDGQYAQSTSDVAIVDSKERARLREACAGGGATACQKRRIGWGGPETHANPNRFTEVKFPDVKALHQAKQCLRRPIL